MDDFETVYVVYPRKQGRFNAEIWWKKNKPSKELVDKMLAAIKKRKAEKVYLASKRQFVSDWPHFSTWLNQRRWEDGFDEGFEKSLTRSFRPKRVVAVKLNEALKSNPALHKLREQKK